MVTIGQFNRCVFFDVRIDRANAYVQTSHIKNALQLRHIGQIKHIARVVLGNHQQIARFRAYFFNRSHSGLHRQGQHFWRQVVPSTGVEIGIYWCEFEASVANIDRAVERWRVLHPFQPEPALNGWHGVKYALLKFVDGAGQCRDEMGNHGVLGRWCAILGVCAQTCRAQKGLLISF